jgi:hypothetical protein
VSLSLAIHLDGDDADVAAGEEVRGRVEVRSDTGGEVRGVALTVMWQTEGSGNRVTGTSHEIPLLDGPTPLGRGETRTLPFRFTAPDGPLSYDGTHLRIVNVIRASADVRWARDPSAERPYQLRRAGDQAAGFQGPLLNLATATPGPARVRSRPRSVELLLASAAVLAGIGLAAGAALSGSSPPLLTILLAAAGLTVAAAVLLPFRARIAEGRLGRVSLVLDRAVAAPGDTIRVALTCRPRTDIRIQRAVASLRGRERVVRGKGQHRVSRQHTFAHIEAHLTDEMTAAAKRQVTLWAELPLAPDCPCSFQARDNRLEWEVQVRIAIAGWPDWVASHRVLVWPARGHAPGHTRP